MSPVYLPNQAPLISNPGSPRLVAGGFPLALLATMMIEGTIILAYAAANGLRTYHWLTYALLINLITQPTLWSVMGRLPADIAYFPSLSAAESLVCVVEAGLFHLLTGDQLGIGDALALSLVLNVASCGVGLLLPV